MLTKSGADCYTQPTCHFPHSNCVYRYSPDISSNVFSNELNKRSFLCSTFLPFLGLSWRVIISLELQGIDVLSGLQTKTKNHMNFWALLLDDILKQLCKNTRPKIEFNRKRKVCKLPLNHHVIHLCAWQVR